MLPREQADVEQIERFIERLGVWRQKTERTITLSWLGGEPLLWAPRLELDKRAARHGIKLSLTTNGTQLNSRHVRADLIARYAEVTVSIDGMSNFHDAMRGWRGAFAKLTQSVPALVEERTAGRSDLKVRVNVVLMRDNIADFPMLCNTLASWGVDEISFNQLGGRDRPEFHPDHRLQADDVTMLTAMLPQLRENLSKLGTVIVGSSAYLRWFAHSVEGMPLPIADCRVADNFLFIDEAGRIAPCSFSPEHFDMSVDDIHSSADFDALPLQLRAYQNRHPAPDCANCPSTQQFSKFEASMA